MSEPAPMDATEYAQRRELGKRLEVALSKVYGRAADEARAVGLHDLGERWDGMARAYANAPAHTAQYVDRLQKQRRGG